jgi:hypothetical protein
MRKASLKAWGALYGNGIAPTPAEVEEELQASIGELSEYQHQARLHSWLTKIGVVHFAPCNEGKRTEKEQRALSVVGFSCGIPDIIIPIARKPHYGLMIELKTSGGTLSGAQKWWLQKLSEEGYRAIVSRSLVDSQKIVVDYLNLTRW